jgi:hypothetical protein
MSLPSIVTPQYSIQLVSLPQPITIRPYLVKEEKILLMAQHGGDPKEIESAVKQIITNCTNGSVDVNKLPSFDVEYLFLQLRAKSVNDVIESQFQCENIPNPAKPTERCGALVPVTINIDDIKPTVPANHTNTIMITTDLGVRLKYPTAETPTDDVLAALASCIEVIFNKTTGETWETSQETPDAIQAFVGELSLGQVEKLKDFFYTMPHLEYTFEFKCPKCQYTESITLRGLSDFFD